MVVFLIGWWLVVSGFPGPIVGLQCNSAALVIRGVEVPVEADGINKGASSATDES